MELQLGVSRSTGLFISLGELLETPGWETSSAAPSAYKSACAPQVTSIASLPEARAISSDRPAGDFLDGGIFRRLDD